MKFILNKDKLTVEDKETYNSGSVNYYEADVEHDESWNDLVIEARLIKKEEGSGVSISVITNKVALDKKLSGKYFIGFIGYRVENNEKVYQISSDLQAIRFRKGAGELEVSNGDSTPELTEWEVYIAQLQGFVNEAQEIVDEADTLDIDVNKEGSKATITLTQKDGTTKEVEIYDGQGGGTYNYNELSNKPSINNVPLSGNKTSTDLGLQPAGNYANEGDIPTKLSELQNDSGFITEYRETDPTVPNHVKNIRQEDISNWNNKSEFSGNYNDLSNKPAIPSKISDLTNDSGFVDNTYHDNTKQDVINDLQAIRSGASKGATAVQLNDLSEVATTGSYNDLTNKPTIPTKTSDLNNDSGFINNSVNNLVNYTLATDTGATIELSINSSTYVMTLNLKNSDGQVISTGNVDLPLETMVVNASYDSTHKTIVLTLQNGNTTSFSVADLVSGLQTEITSTNKLSSDLVDDSNHSNKFVTAAQITKLNGIENNAEVNIIEKIKVNNVEQTISNKAVNINVPTKTSDITNDSGFITSGIFSYNSSTQTLTITTT